LKKIRIVVIDDSAYNRRTITKMLEAMPNVDVVGYACDGEEGIRKIVDLKPDMVTLDLEMPKMDGFTMLRIVMSSFPLPVMVISAKSGDSQVFKALELGAVDFIAKPSGRISEDILKINEDLHAKVNNVFNLNMAWIKKRETIAVEETPLIPAKVDSKPFTGRLTSRIDMVAIGASTGGPPALQNIFSAITVPPPFSVAVCQHMPAGFTKGFAERLSRATAMEVREAKDGDCVLPGLALVAPGGMNMVFQPSRDGTVVRIVDPSPQERFVPSVDAMFTSLAAAYGTRLLAVVLTGMGNDGSRGVKAVKKSGGQVLAESEESSIVFGMPREAIATGAVDRIASLDRMAGEIIARCDITQNPE
jgi:two-component system chemotaxis response regulator CheB